MKISRSRYDSLVSKCWASSRNTYDTRSYRYRYLATGELVRCEISCVDHASGLSPDVWETLVPSDLEEV